MACLDYQKALEFAEKKHFGQYRIGGEPYIVHPIATCEIIKKQGYPLEYQIAALFHDLLEDTDASEDEILSLSNENVLEAVKILTKKDDVQMREYVEAVKSNKIAFAVKCADRLNNLQSAFCTSEDFKRKYVLETVKYYMDFSPEIREAVTLLAKSMINPLNINFK